MAAERLSDGTFSVDLEAMAPEELRLFLATSDGDFWLSSLALVSGGSASHGDTVRLGAVSREILFRYVLECWGDEEFASVVVYGDSDRTPESENARLVELACAAYPLSDDEWGSDRQIDAQNAFHLACEDRDPVTFADDGEFNLWCLKATSEEMIDQALKLLGLPVPAHPRMTAASGW